MDGARRRRHVLGDDLSLLARQRDKATNGLLLYSQDHPGLGFRELLDGFNEQWVRAAAFLGPDLTIALLRLSGEWSAAFYDACDLDDPCEPVRLFGGGGSAPYWQVIAREYVERWAHHHQIRRAVGSPDLGGPLETAACEVVVRTIAASLPGCGAESGQSIQLAFGTGRWTVVRGDGEWQLATMPADTADVVVTVAAHRVTPVLSRALAAADVVGHLAVTGDTALAGAAVPWLSSVFGRPS